MYVYIYTHIYIYMHVCVCVYVCIYVSIYIHPYTSGKKLSRCRGKRLLLREKKAQKVSPPPAGETPDPCHLSGPARDDIKHLQTLNTFRHQTPMLAGGRRRRHGTHAPRSHTQTGPAARTKSLYPSVGTRNESHSAFVKESSWHSAADSEELVSSWPLLGLSD